MKIATAYHGTNYFIRSTADIKINERSTKQFYGAAFYVNFSKEKAGSYGKYVFEVKFDAEKMYNATSFLDVRTLGVFEQFLEIVRNSAEEYLTEEQLTSKDVDEHIENYIEANHETLLNQYIEEQGYINDELQDEFDGIIDETQCAIFFPQKVILGLQFVEESPSVVVVI